MSDNRYKRHASEDRPERVFFTRDQLYGDGERCLTVCGEQFSVPQEARSIWLDKSMATQLFAELAGWLYDLDATTPLEEIASATPFTPWSPTGGWEPPVQKSEMPSNYFSPERRVVFGSGDAAWADALGRYKAVEEPEEQLGAYHPSHDIEHDILDKISGADYYDQCRSCCYSSRGKELAKPCKGLFDVKE